MADDDGKKYWRYIMPGMHGFIALDILVQWFNLIWQAIGLVGTLVADSSGSSEVLTTDEVLDVDT